MLFAMLMVLEERKLFWAEFALPDGFPDRAEARRFMRSPFLFALWALSTGPLLNMGLRGGSGVGWTTIFSMGLTKPGAGPVG